MILGIGSDLVDMRRVEAVLLRRGERFLRRVFTQGERETANGRGDPVPTYAKRFAAKEACAKALGSGIWRHGVHFTDIEVANDGNGKPVILLTGAALAWLQAMTPAGKRASVHLSLTDEPPYAQAFVVIEAES